MTAAWEPERPHERLPPWGPASKFPGPCCQINLGWMEHSSVPLSPATHPPWLLVSHHFPIPLASAKSSSLPTPKSASFPPWALAPAVLFPNEFCPNFKAPSLLIVLPGYSRPLCFLPSSQHLALTTHTPYFPTFHFTFQKLSPRYYRRV